MAAKRDYYEVLGISKSASPDEIKRAYRKMAHKYHPDKGGGDEAKFKEASEAYEVLKDQKKRSAYDQFGHNAPGGQAGGGGGWNVDFDGFDFSGFGGADDIFNMFFRGAQNSRRQTRGRDVETSITLEFSEAVFGATKEITINLNDLCDRCAGDGAEPGSKLKTCPVCKGAGQINRVQNTILGAMQQSVVCHECSGMGKIPENPCTKCRGKGIVNARQTLSVKIPAGVDDGQSIRLPGKGEAVIGGTKGDLYIHIRVRRDPKFERRGVDIYSGAVVGMAEAALGTQIKVPTLEGSLDLKVPAGTQSGQVIKLSGRGVPRARGGRGDLLIEVSVEIPKKLSDKQKELLEQFQAVDKKPFWKK